MPPINLSSNTVSATTLQSIEITIEAHKIEPISNSNDEEIGADDNVAIPSSESTVAADNHSVDEEALEQNDEDYYYTQFLYLDNSDDDSDYFCDNDDNNDECYLTRHLDRKQLSLVDDFEKTKYQRAKRSNKKNKILYMHHRLVKTVVLDPPSRNHSSGSTSDRPYSSEGLRSVPDEKRNRKTVPNVQKATIQKPASNVPPNQLSEYTINDYTLQNNISFDDAMIAFLLEMQNRELSPNDYEMLLRLDECVQRKTVDASALDRLPTTNVSESHLNDHCTICMETYALGQQIKTLPCTHIFHVNCIEIYLKEFSIQCPLDNLPLV
ncbi:unnamed protein product [Rotaria socialis]|uniref:RING-type domain-containing protein n=1 Tax=Rotaria socialis TaxID=392032 RepID=A0A821MJ51_9BILA|nr:unnamed protein product [Rotaria socialis]CAF4165814.1 unnamed protein product [Rotaria socialis]CAF4768400.1 unnamed protein product [Rotaria socialis]